jgi:hypothetical protein
VFITKAHTGHRNRKRRLLSCCGTRYLPRRIAVVSYRPLPLAPLPVSATGGGRVAPPLSRFFGDFLAGPRKSPAGGKKENLPDMGEKMTKNAKIMIDILFFLC